MGHDVAPPVDPNADVASVFTFAGTADQILDMVGESAENLFALFVYAKHYDQQGLTEHQWG